MTGTPSKRMTLFGKKDGPPRRVPALIVVTPSSNCQTAYLTRSADASGFKVAYIATKSNNPDNVKVVALSEDALHDCVVILPGDVRPIAEDIADLGVKGYKVFDLWKKQDYPNTDEHLPANSKDTDQFFVVRGPKALPLVHGDTPYHGPADDDAQNVIAITHGSAVASMFLQMATHFKPEVQTFLKSQHNTFPDCVYKKSHPSRPLCVEFATTMDGLTEDFEEKVEPHIDLLLKEIRATKPLPGIPKRTLLSPKPPVNRITIPGARDDDEDTLATGEDSVSSAHTRKQLGVLLNNGTYTARQVTHSLTFPTPRLFTVSTNDAGVPHMPVLTPEGQDILNITKAQDFNSEYKRALIHLGDTWCADPNAKPLQCHVELGNDTPGMTAYAAANVVSTRRATLPTSQPHIALVPSSRQHHWTTFPSHTSFEAPTSTTTSPFLVAAHSRITRSTRKPTSKTSWA